MTDRLGRLLQVNHHVSDFGGLCQMIEDAARAGFPNTHRRFKDSQTSRPYVVCDYSAVHALLLHWEEDDLGVKVEVERLRTVLEEYYRYSVEEWVIPSTDSHNQLGDEIRRFSRAYKSKDNLLVVYYGGHGYLNAQRQHIWRW